MTKRKADILRPDKRIAATADTIAFLFDVSVPTLMKAVKAGVIAQYQFQGVTLYRVADIERAVFGDADRDAVLDAEHRPMPDPIRERIAEYAAARAERKASKLAEAARGKR